MRTLRGRTVALLEGRQRGELAHMVLRLGGTPVSAPAVRERPTGIDAGPVLARLIAGEFPYVIVLTGAGASALFAEADRRGLRDPVRQAMASLRIVTRGPKPQTALKRYELSASISTAKPHTTQDLLDALAGVPLEGVPVLLLHYGEMNAAFTDALKERGARVEDLCLYEWTLPDDVEPLRRLVRQIVAGEIDALLFTSQIQFRYLIDIAREADAAADLLGALNDRVIVGAVGPVCAAALVAGGVVPDVLPASPNSASLVGAVADYFELTARQE